MNRQGVLTEKEVQEKLQEELKQYALELRYLEDLDAASKEHM